MAELSGWIWAWRSDMKIREWTADDTAELVQWAQQKPEMFAAFGVENPSEADVYAAAASALITPTTLWMAIENRGQELCGLGVLTHISADGSGRAHLVAGPKYHGTGYGMLITALRYAFEVLRVETLQVLMPRDNPLAKRLDLFAGFTELPIDLLQLTAEDWKRRTKRRRRLDLVRNHAVRMDPKPQKSLRRRTG